MRKWMKIGFIIVGVIVLAGVVLLLMFGDMILVFKTNHQVAGSVESMPVVKERTLPPVTKDPTDWPRWRGLNDSRATVGDLITDWTNGLERVWEVNYLCSGPSSATWSSPVIQGNRLVATGRHDSLDVVFCFHSQTGDLLWKSEHEAPAGSSYGTGARATPCIDQDRVYAFSRNGDLTCLALLDGRVLWRTNVNDAGGQTHTWGHSTSPLVLNHQVIVNGGGQARTLSFDKYSGELLWKTGQGYSGYAALTAMPMDGLTAVLSFHGEGLAALDSKTGQPLWNYPWKTQSRINATTPVFSGDSVFITSSYGEGSALLAGSSSGVTLIWTSEAIASHHSDPFIIDGFIYGYSGLSVQNRGRFKCVDMKTGKEMWSTNELGWGTGLLVNELLLAMDIKGNLFLASLSPAELSLVTKLPRALGKIRGAAWTMPVVAGNKLYLRFKQKLICYQIGK